MHFRVVAQRLKMADAFRRPGDRLLVDDRRVAKGHTEAQPLPDHALQDLFLYLSHDLGRDLFFLLVVVEVQGRIFLFQNAEIPVRFEQVLALRKDHGAAEHRLQQFLLASGLSADPLPHAGPCEARHRADFARLRLLPGLELRPGIQADLLDLLGISLVVRAVRHGRLDLERAAGQLHPGEPCAAVPRDLEDSRPELVSIPGRVDHDIQCFQKLRHALLAERRAEEDREELSLSGELPDLIDADRLSLQIAVQKIVVADSDLLLHFRVLKLFCER